MNKKWLKVIKRFNTPGTALVVSAWPVTGKNAVDHGIAWYTKMTVSEMAKKQGKKFVILAETNHDNKPQLLVNGKVLVLRVFDNTHKSLYPRILRWLQPFNQIKTVYVHSEFGASGGIWHFAAVLPFLTLIRAMGKQIVFYSHNVVADAGMLSGHLNINQFQAYLLNIGITVYYALLNLLVDKIVVLDPMLGRRLAQFVSPQKIVNLIMPVEKKSSISKLLARKKLGLSQTAKVITSFGFVSWYKGTDWLVEQVPSTLTLLIAGGPSYSLSRKPHYKRYYEHVSDKADRKDNVTISGFVPEEKVGWYMSAADLVVLPYRGLMGASGALSNALSYQKPFMISKGMGGLDTHSFTLTQDGMSKIDRVLHSKYKLAQLGVSARKLAQERDLAKLAKREYNELYAQVFV